MPDFLPLPERATKPRTAGLTHVIDTGLSSSEVDGLLRQAAAHIDTVRLGWGSAYVTADLEDKLAAYRQHDVPVMLGGALTELAWLHERLRVLCARPHRRDRPRDRSFRAHLRGAAQAPAGVAHRALRRKCQPRQRAAGRRALARDAA